MTTRSSRKRRRQSFIESEEDTEESDGDYEPEDDTLKNLQRKNNRAYNNFVEIPSSPMASHHRKTPSADTTIPPHHVL